MIISKNVIVITKTVTYIVDSILFEFKGNPPGLSFFPSLYLFRISDDQLTKFGYSK